MDTLKSLAKQAKERLVNGYWNDVAKRRRAELEKAEQAGESISKANEDFRKRITTEVFAGKELIDKEEAEYALVSSVLRGEIAAPNPITVLIDADYYRIEDEEAKQRYLLKLAGKFAVYKKRFESENHSVCVKEDNDNNQGANRLVG